MELLEIVVEDVQWCTHRGVWATVA